MPAMNMIQALNSALDTAMTRDPNVLSFGQDAGYFGGVFRVTEGLQAKYGKHRCFDAPISEGGIVGTAVGMGAYGLRPVAEIQFADFIWPATNQIISEAARLRYRSNDGWGVPMVIRAPYGGGIHGALYHSQSVEALFYHVPGLKVVIPSTPLDAYNLLVRSIRDPDPVIFLEPKSRYWSKESGDLSVDGLPIGASRVVREGQHATIVAWGGMVARGLQAAEAAAEDGVELEVVDLRSLSPIDWPTVVESVRRTGRCVVVHEAPVTLGLGAEIAARVTEECFYSLEAPVLRVGGYDTPYPPSKLEEEYLPDLDRVLDAVDRSLEF